MKSGEIEVFAFIQIFENLKAVHTTIGGKIKETTKNKREVKKMKKILIPVLAILILVFVFQIVSVMSGNSYAATKYEPKCKSCYPVCVAYCLPMDGCYRPDYDVCKSWETQCFDVPCGAAYNIPPQN